MNSLEYAAKIAEPFEGFVSDPYHDPVGYPTRGYGELLSLEKWADLKQWKSVTREEAHQNLMNHMLKDLSAIRRLISVSLSEAQEGSLIDFAYNLGTGALQSSTLRRRLNQGIYEDVPAQLMRWNKAGGRILRGLTRRREAEASLWVSGS